MVMVVINLLVKNVVLICLLFMAMSLVKDSFSGLKFSIGYLKWLKYQGSRYNPSTNHISCSSIVSPKP